ncbi:hypothetical protein [Comamonas sp. NoAH]|uniref:phage adaptor protein n=1 Tax=Comamonas halotolerans TaxID=3041496 RepID=UPI0024E05CB5|nr:hypothetical protein [Comamonas sp. NoAH]
MRLKQMIEMFRAELGDTQKTYLWEDSELVHYLNQAVQEACERALLIEDRYTPSVCQFQTAIGTDSYELHSSLIKIKRMTVAARLLRPTCVEELDDECPGWERQTGVPHSFIWEGTQGSGRPRVRLVPTPAMEAEVRMTVYRGALKPLEVDSDAEPEIPVSLHDGLKHWVYRCALLKNDADAQDAVRAADHEALFTNIFGAKTDANVARKRRDRNPPLIHCAW